MDKERVEELMRQFAESGGGSAARSLQLPETSITRRADPDFYRTGPDGDRNLDPEMMRSGPSVNDPYFSDPEGYQRLLLPGKEPGPGAMQLPEEGAPLALARDPELHGMAKSGLSDALLKKLVQSGNNNAARLYADAQGTQRPEWPGYPEPAAQPAEAPYKSPPNVIRLGETTIEPTKLDEISITAGDSTAAPAADPDMLEPGNIDLSKRPHVKNPDGSESTVYSMGVNIDGKEYLIPTISDDGRRMSGDEAVEYFKATGKHLGVYASPEASTRAALKIHEDQEANPLQDTLAGQPDHYNPDDRQDFKNYEKTSGDTPESLSWKKYQESVARGQIPTGQNEEADRTIQESKDAGQAAVDELNILLAKQQPAARSDRLARLEAKIEGLRPRSRIMAAFSQEGTRSYDRNMANYTGALMELHKAAREEENGDAPLDHATMEVLVRTGVMSPERAAAMKMGSPFVRALGQGGLGLGLKERGQDFDMKKTGQKADSAETIAAGNNVTSMENSERRTEATKEQARIKAGDAGATAPPASWLSMQVSGNGVSLTPEQATAYQNGSLDPRTVDPKALSLARSYTEGWLRASPTERQKLQTQTYGREGKTADALDENLQRQQQNVKDQMKFKTELVGVGTTIKAARDAYRALRPEEKEAIAQYSGQTPLSHYLMKLSMDADGQVAKSRLDRLVMYVQRIQSGMSSTDKEFERISGTAGMAGQNYDWLNTPATMEAFLADTSREWEQRVHIAKQYYPNLFQGPRRVQR